MANLKEIRTRIESVKSTGQITNAMKMVSASKLRKAQDAILQMRPYAFKIHEILNHCQLSMPRRTTPYYSRQNIRKVLIIVIGSNKGLCGAFNINVSKKAIELATGNYSELFKSDMVDFIVIGKKAEDYLRSKNIKTDQTRHDLLDKPSFDNILPFTETLIGYYTGEKYDTIELVFNQFHNAAVQIVTNETFLPLDLAQDNCTKEEVEMAQLRYLIEPTGDFLFERLIPKVLKAEFYKAILESLASEFGARMTSMHKAADNADKLRSELRTTYNKARQSNITNEIIEIVGGAEALKLNRKD